MAEKGKRPILVALLAILYLLMGVLCLAAGAMVAVGGVAVEEIELGAVGAGAMVIAGLILILIFYGFWKGWSIFWYIGLIVAIIGLVVGIYSMIMGNFTVLLEVIIDIIILLYLRSEKVKNFFLG